MDSSANQVHELHKKFEALNEDVTAALRAQHEALGPAGGALSTIAGGKRDALRLAARTTEWRGDVAALARHIGLQLQHSRALRAHHAQQQVPGADTKRDDDEGARRLRCLRSDLRLLQEFRVDLAAAASPANESTNNDGVNGPASGATDDIVVAEETVRDALSVMQMPRGAHLVICWLGQRQLQEFLEKSVKREKVDPVAPLALELFERRRELMRQIAETVLPDAAAAG